MERPGEAQSVPGRIGEGETVEDQPDGQKLDESAWRHRANRAIPADFDLAEHSSPPTQGEQRRGDVLFPIALRDAQDLERPADRFERIDVPLVERGELSRQPLHPAFGRPAGLSIKGTKRADEPFVAAGERPLRQTLVEKRRAEADEQVVHRLIGILTGRIQEEVSGTDGRRGRRSERRQVADTVTADPPERLEREPFPIVIAPAFDA